MPYTRDALLALSRMEQMSKGDARCSRLWEGVHLQIEKERRFEEWVIAHASELAPLQLAATTKTIVIPLPKHLFAHTPAAPRLRFVFFDYPKPILAARCSASPSIPLRRHGGQRRPSFTPSLDTFLELVGGDDPWW